MRETDSGSADSINGGILEKGQLELIANSDVLDRGQAAAQLDALVGQDLRLLAPQYGIRVWHADKLNKGWAGQTIEAYLGRSPNSDRAADFGDWELKSASLILGADRTMRAKESMAIAMFTGPEIEEQDFEDSHLLEKLGRILIAARLYVDADESSSPFLGTASFDLDDTLYAQVVEDYEEARWLVRNEGVHALSGRVGRLIQPRVKGGAGAGRGGHCFYARAQFVGYMLGLVESPY